MIKKRSAEEVYKLLADFDNTVLPWCKENELSLHQAFEISRKSDKEKYTILTSLWHTYIGKAYLKSCFCSHGGRLKP